MAAARILGVAIALIGVASAAHGVEKSGRDAPSAQALRALDTGQWEGAIGSHPRGEWNPAVDLYEDYLKPTAPHATYVRAKIYKIDTGREEWLDYGRILQILRDVDFNGIIGLVFELGDRNGCDEVECRRLAVRHLREKIAAAYS